MNFLKRLFGRQEAPVELPPEFLQDIAPDWLIDLKGQGPQGAPFSIRAQIVSAARTGTADITLLPGAQGGEAKSATVALEKTELDRLFVILGFSFPADIQDAPGGTEAGMPATVAIHRREPYTLATGQCQLAEWIDSRKPGPPLVEIARVLMEVQRRAGLT